MLSRLGIELIDSPFSGLRVAVPCVYIVSNVLCVRLIRRAGYSAAPASGGRGLANSVSRPAATPAVKGRLFYVAVISHFVTAAVLR